MEHLEDISGDDLRNALDAVEDSKPTQRLLAAIAYKNGVTQTELAEWFGVERRTIYGWLERLDADSLERAVEDTGRPGRPRKLAERDQRELERTLREPPTAVGYEAPTWTPDLVRTHLEDAYGVDYSRSSCRRLMKESGLRYRRSRRTTIDDAGNGRDEDDRDGGWVPE